MLCSRSDLPTLGTWVNRYLISVTAFWDRDASCVNSLGIRAKAALPAVADSKPHPIEPNQIKRD